MVSIKLFDDARPTVLAGTEPVGIDAAAGLLFGSGPGTGCGSNGVCGDVGWAGAVAGGGRVAGGGVVPAGGVWANREEPANSASIGIIRFIKSRLYKGVQ